MSRPLLVILMGSPADGAHAAAIAEAAEGFGIEAVRRIGSAHKGPARVLALLAEYEADPRPKVYATVAGRSNALSGLVDGAVAAPVIACPPPAEAFGGADLWSSLRMPSGIAPALVLEPANAALLAAKILALSSPALAEGVLAFQRAQAERLEAADLGLCRDRGAPADGAPADGAPADGAPADGAPADGAPAGGAPADGAPADGAPADGAPADGAPADGAPADGAGPGAPSPAGASAGGGR